jgi:hypothetical protein
MFVAFSPRVRRSFVLSCRYRQITVASAGGVEPLDPGGIDPSSPSMAEIRNNIARSSDLDVSGPERHEAGASVARYTPTEQSLALGGTEGASEGASDLGDSRSGGRGDRWWDLRKTGYSDLRESGRESSFFASTGEDWQYMVSSCTKALYQRTLTVLGPPLHSIYISIRPLCTLPSHSSIRPLCTLPFIAFDIICAHFSALFCLLKYNAVTNDFGSQIAERRYSGPMQVSTHSSRGPRNFQERCESEASGAPALEDGGTDSQRRNSSDLSRRRTIGSTRSQSMTDRLSGLISFGRETDQGIRGSGLGHARGRSRVSKDRGATCREYSNDYPNRERQDTDATDFSTSGR